MMYPALLSRLMVAVVLFSLCLQGCRSNFRVTSGESVLKKARKTSHDEQVPHQYPVSSTVYDGGPSIAASVNSLSSLETSSVQIASPTRHLTVEPNVGPFLQQALLTEPEETDTKPATRPTPVFGAREWDRYFGEVGVAPPLPSDLDEILGSPCPFWPGKQVMDTHLLVLIPSTVGGKAFTLDLLGELIQNPLGGSHRTQYFLYDDEVQRSSGDIYSSSSYWILLTHDVLPSSRNKPYETQKALVASQTIRIKRVPYEIPNVLEAATAILSHYVCSGSRLYEEGGDALPSTSTRCEGLLEDAAGYPSPVTVGRFCTRGLVFLSGFDDDAEFGISCLHRFGSRHYRPSALLHSFGAEEWSQYFGEVGVAPPLPVNIVDTLNSACPFWPDSQVKDTHLLVLIPATVNGKPFSLNLLRELIQHPRGEGHATKYRVYDNDVQEQLGARSPGNAYWVLMTQDVLEGSRDETYAFQQDLVAGHVRRTGIPYELPGALEAATVILSHYVCSGVRLYTDDPWTYTRCRDLVVWDGGNYPVVVGGGSSEGIFVSPHVISDYSSFRGVASLRKF